MSDDETTPAPTTPAPSHVPGFETEIRPLFREFDRTSMLKAFDLWNYDDVRTHQAAILERVAAGTMPCDGPWTQSNVSLLEAWIGGGSPR
jgi:hypothetical protein